MFQGGGRKATHVPGHDDFIGVLVPAVESHTGTRARSPPKWALLGSAECVFVRTCVVVRHR